MQTYNNAAIKPQNETMTKIKMLFAVNMLPCEVELTSYTSLE